MSGRSGGQPGVPADAFRQWLAGQRMADKVVEEERHRWLAQLDQETALRLYLELVSLPGARPRERTPSPVLAAMRQAIARKRHDAG